MMTFELGIVVEQKRQRLVDLHRGEIAGAAALETKNASEEFGGGNLIARRHNGVVENDRHRCLLA
jgi:hypothetical protein